jgi:DinB superfamily
MMQWTEILNKRMDYSFDVADKLMGLLEEGDLDWKPGSGQNWMTTGQLLMHMTSACGFCCRGFATGDWGLPEGVTMDDVPPQEMMPPAEKMPTVGSVDEARKALAADKQMGLDIVAKAGEERLENEVSSAPWAPGMDKCLGAHMLNMCEHLDSHKHQLFYYLKLMGRDVNTGHLWGM